MLKSGTMERGRTLDEEREGKKTQEKSPPSRSQVYKENEVEKPSMAYSVSVSNTKSSSITSTTEKKRNRVQCIPVIQKTVTGDEDGLVWKY